MEEEVSMSPRLPDDIIEQIIFRLPPKAVSKFKCASKSWRRRLSHPSFASNYRIRNLSLRCFFSNVTYGIISYIFADDFSHNYEQIRWYDNTSDHAVAAAGNLMVFYQSTKGDPSSSSFFIADPLTRERIDLPPPPPATDSDTVFNSKRFLVYGLAYDFLSSDPTNFMFCELTDAADSSRDLMVNKYCSVRRRWFTHVFPDLHIVDDFVLSGRAVYLNSNLHWLIEEPSTHILVYDTRYDTVLNYIQIPFDHEFDFVDYDTGICDCPNNNRNRMDDEEEYLCKCRYLGECGGKLVYIRVTGNSEFTMWILRDYVQAEWSPRARFLINDPDMPLRSVYLTSLYNGEVFWCTLTKEGDVIVYFLIGRFVFSFNCRSGKLEKSWDFAKICDEEPDAIGPCGPCGPPIQ